MFTGIVEEVGSVLEIENRSRDYRLKIACSKVLEGTEIGDSIATNGVCLTVVDLGQEYFQADVMAESLRMSNLEDLSRSSKVNLERALSLNTRLGGHIVTGHIDSLGKIIDISQEKNAIWYEIETESSTMKYIINKGSIAVDGISLTVADLRETSFLVSIIPHTRMETSLGYSSVGDRVNLETDIVGKYIERLLNFDSSGQEKKDISMDLLMENGFI